jgi:hypothetical protein
MITGRIADPAILAMHDEFVYSREAYQDVNNVLYWRPGTEYQINKVPIAAHEPAQADQTPVEGADDDEDPRNHVQPFVVHNNCMETTCNSTPCPQYDRVSNK